MENSQVTEQLPDVRNANFSAAIRKMTLKAFVVTYYEAMAGNMQGTSGWQYDLCLAEDERRGGKAHAKALAKLHDVFGIKTEGNTIDLRDSTF